MNIPEPTYLQEGGSYVVRSTLTYKDNTGLKGDITRTFKIEGRSSSYADALKNYNVAKISASRTMEERSKILWPSGVIVIGRDAETA